MFRKMLHFKRDDNESIDCFMERTNRTIKGLMATRGIEQWDHTAHRFVFQWEACLSRLTLADPARYTALIFAFKDWRWIGKIARQNNGRQLHCRYLRTWRWERPMYLIIGDNWQEVAQDKERWNNLVPSFVESRAIGR